MVAGRSCLRQEGLPVHDRSVGVRAQEILRRGFHRTRGHRILDGSDIVSVEVKEHVEIGPARRWGRHWMSPHVRTEPGWSSPDRVPRRARTAARMARMTSSRVGDRADRPATAGGSCGRPSSRSAWAASPRTIAPSGAVGSAGSCRSSRPTPTATASSRSRAISSTSGPRRSAWPSSRRPCAAPGGRPYPSWCWAGSSAPDPAVPREGLTLTASSVDKLPRDRRDRARHGCHREGPPEDRHGHGADRRALLQCAGPPRARVGLPARRRWRASLPLRQCRRRRSRLRARPARALPRRLACYDKQGVAPPVRHMANSGPSSSCRRPPRHVRPGILLYGVYPRRKSGGPLPVQPALALEVPRRLLQGRDARSSRELWLHVADRPPDARVTVPVGYGDGYFRALSNVAQVLIRGKCYPVVGRVSMDQITVNIEWDSAYNGDPVVLLGGDGDVTSPRAPRGVGRHDPYEVLTNINGRVPRVYVVATFHLARAHVGI